MPRFTNTSSYHNNNNQEVAPAAPAYKNVLNPLACEDNNNNMMNGTYNNNNNNHHVIQEDNMATLRAASHVSMENSPQAHEYNPTCKCADCQYLLNNFSNYSTLDDYTAIHLKYEAEQHQKYGRVPCIDGMYSEYGYADVCVGTDSHTGQPVYENKYGILTTAYLFHCHLHHMNAISPEVRARSLDRYHTNKGHTVATPQQQRIAMPAPRHHFNNNKKPSYTTNAAAAPVPSYYNNNAVPSYYNNNSNNNTAAPYYSESDINQAKRDVAFCGVASLG